MRSVRYGSATIDYSILEKEGLKSHYISVDKTSGVVLKGKSVAPPKADKLILKKAKWILDKLRVVGRSDDGDIVTGSRLPYLGKSYYVQIYIDTQVSGAMIEFNHSKFTIRLNNTKVSQVEIKKSLESFYKTKAIDKLTPRVHKLSAVTNLKYKSLRFIKMNKRWGSCTGNNTIILNIEAIKLPFTLIDYLIIHELTHAKIKNHSKQFWAEISKHLPHWKALDARLKEIKL